MRLLFLLHVFLHLSYSNSASANAGWGQFLRFVTAPTHILIGFSGVVFCGHAAGLSPGPLGLFAVIVGSLAPDIDGNGSIRRPCFLIKPFVGWRVANALDGIVELSTSFVGLLLGHRGFLHAPLLGLALLAAGGISDGGWLYWFGLGYALHTYGDYMTVAGIPVFSPFSRRTYSGSNLRVGSRAETLLTLLLAPVVCIAGWSLLPEAVRKAHMALLGIL